MHISDKHLVVYWKEGPLCLRGGHGRFVALYPTRCPAILQSISVGSLRLTIGGENSARRMITVLPTLNCVPAFH